MRLNLLNSPMGLKGHNFQIKWPFVEPSGDPLAEALVRDVFRKEDSIADSQISADNGSSRSWGRDLDPTPGRALFKTQFGMMEVALCTGYDTETGHKKYRTASSDNGRVMSKITYDENGEINSVYEKRNIYERTEELTITINDDGTLTYRETIS